MDTLSVNNRKQKLDNIINKITEGQLSKIREATSLAFDHACIHNRDSKFTINPRQERDTDMDQAKSINMNEKEVGHSPPEGAGPSSELPGPMGHGANM